MADENSSEQAVSRLNIKKQTLDDMYSVPANFLEIDVVNPTTTILAGKKRYVDYEIKMRVSYHQIIVLPLLLSLELSLVFEFCLLFQSYLFIDHIGAVHMSSFRY